MPFPYQFWPHVSKMKDTVWFSTLYPQLKEKELIKGKSIWLEKIVFPAVIKQFLQFDPWHKDINLLFNPYLNGLILLTYPGKFYIQKTRAISNFSSQGY